MKGLEEWNSSWNLIWRPLGHYSSNHNLVQEAVPRIPDYGSLLKIEPGILLEQFLELMMNSASKPIIKEMSNSWVPRRRQSQEMKRHRSPAGFLKVISIVCILRPYVSYFFVGVNQQLLRHYHRELVHHLWDPTFGFTYYPFISVSWIPDSNSNTLFPASVYDCKKET